MLAKPLQAQTDLEHEVANLLVGALILTVPPSAIDPMAPLFGEGLGLDSIDMLEIALSISKTYGVELKSDDTLAFASLRALATHIEQHRVR
jgi:acyl carrier protein